jgi:5-methyltetrahydrofolate--homocysteine methyltransferase
MEQLLEDLATAIRNGKAKQAKRLIEEAIDQNIPVEEIVNDGMMKAMDYITDTMETATSFVPEIILASRAMDVSMVVLEDLTQGSIVPCIGTVVAATVKGDLHDIGLNLVCMMLRNVGFYVYNMGCDVSADELIRKAEEVHADVICLSAMLTTTMPQIQRIIKLLENKGLREKYKVMVGGAPVTERFAKRIGADVYTSNAVEAAKCMKQMMQEEK